MTETKKNCLKDNHLNFMLHHFKLVKLIVKLVIDCNVLTAVVKLNEIYLISYHNILEIKKVNIFFTKVTKVQG